MKKILGLDMGTNSIGWVLANTEKNSITDYGVKIFTDDCAGKNFPIETSGAKEDLFKKVLVDFPANKLIPFLLAALTLSTAALALLFDWQYWLNISVAFLIAWLTIIKK